MTATDTPRTDAVVREPCAIHQVMQKWEKIIENSRQLERELAVSLENQVKAQAEVERLKGRMKEAEDLIQRGQAGWEKEREFHRKTSENAGREISNLKAIENNLLLDVHTLHTKNVCLQELIQEFYEWTRRDYPTEAEVREIMNRYRDLLNK